MWRFAFFLCLVAVFGDAWALDPAGIDIINFRLGMTEPDVVAELARQGYRDSARHVTGATCPAHCLEARTRDGTLLFRFDPTRGGVIRLSYHFDARKPNEPAILEQSVLARYGPPNTKDPMTWCQPIQDRCRNDSAKLTFTAGAGSTRVLTLSAR